MASHERVQAARIRHHLLLLLVALVLALAQLAAGANPRLAKREVSAGDIANFRGAILVINGKPTSCECALMDNKAAMVAANCLKLDGKSFRAGYKYEIYLDGAKGNAPGKASINPSDIIIHPKFNPSTNSNNMAILQFSFQDQGSWVNYIAAYRDEWSDVAYVRRTLTSASNGGWSTPKVRSSVGEDSKCEKASGLYKYNKQDYYCNRVYTPSPFSTTCNMPYGSIYGVTSTSMAIAGFYSHSVAYGDSVCDDYNVYHYYLVLTNYVKFVRDTIGRAPKEFVDDKDGLSGVRRITNYSMKKSQSANDEGTYMFGGDMVDRSLPIPGPGSPPPSTTTSNRPAATPTPTPSTSTSTSSSDKADDDDNNNTNNNNNDDDDDEKTTTTMITDDEDSGKDTDKGDDKDKGDEADKDKGDEADKDKSDEADKDKGDEADKDKGDEDDKELTELNDDDEDTESDTKLTDPADSSDLYGDSDVDKELAEDDIKEANLDNGMETDEVNDALGGHASGDDPYNGLSKGAVIAMGVAIPLGVILLAIIAYLLYRLYHKGKSPVKWQQNGTVKRQSTMNDLIEEIGGASNGGAAARDDQLPSYEDIPHHALLALSPTSPNHRHT
ncbi:hypothetical protein GGF46_003804 [Coemansia sp. RSA 552]|nr:hypothetical protein GGF46_003804 [Coemansia sp. RSA 552]